MACGHQVPLRGLPGASVAAGPRYDCCGAPGYAPGRLYFRPRGAALRGKEIPGLKPGAGGAWRRRRSPPPGTAQRHYAPCVPPGRFGLVVVEVVMSLLSLAVLAVSLLTVVALGLLLWPMGG